MVHAGHGKEWDSNKEPTDDEKATLDLYSSGSQKRKSCLFTLKPNKKFHLVINEKIMYMFLEKTFRTSLVFVEILLPKALRIKEMIHVLLDFL